MKCNYSALVSDIYRPDLALKTHVYNWHASSVLHLTVQWYRKQLNQLQHYHVIISNNKIISSNTNNTKMLRWKFPHTFYFTLLLFCLHTCSCETQDMALFTKQYWLINNNRYHYNAKHLVNFMLMCSLFKWRPVKCFRRLVWLETVKMLMASKQVCLNDIWLTVTGCHDIFWIIWINRY